MTGLRKSSELSSSSANIIGQRSTLEPFNVMSRAYRYKGKAETRHRIDFTIFFTLHLSNTKSIVIYLPIDKGSGDKKAVNPQ